MKAFTFLFLFLSWSVLSGLGQDSWSPTYPSLERYQATWQKSPFDRDTIASDQPSFADDYALTGISRIGEDWTILLVDRRTRKYLPISSSDKSGDLRIVEVFPHSDKRQAKVKISNGKREAILNFDTELNRATGGKKAKSGAATEPAPAEKAPDAESKTKTPPRRLELRIPKKEETKSE